MPNPLSKLIHPWYPATALGLEKGQAAVVELERRGNVGSLRRAATLKLSDSLINPSFEESNIADYAELAAAIRDLAASAGLLKHKRWSVSLPEATAIFGRSNYRTLSARVASRSDNRGKGLGRGDRGRSKFNQRRIRSR